MTHRASVSTSVRRTARVVAATLVVGSGVLLTAHGAGAQDKVPVDATDISTYDGKPLTDPNVKVKPFNECYVKNDDGSVISYFGYELGAPEEAKLEAGTGYNFVTGAAANSGQPTLLTSGVNNFVFSVTWDSSTDAPQWYLNGVGVGATDSGTACREIPAVPEFPFAAAGPVIAVGAFGVWFAVRRRRLPSVA